MSPVDELRPELLRQLRLERRHRMEGRRAVGRGDRSADRGNGRERAGDDEQAASGAANGQRNHVLDPLEDPLRRPRAPLRRGMVSLKNASAKGAGSMASMPSEHELLEALRQVEDPELGMDVVDLGLVYEVEVEGPKVKIIYSLTSMGCPAGPLIAGDMERVSREVPGVEDVELELVFDPPWTPDKMSDDAKFILGFG